MSYVIEVRGISGTVQLTEAFEGPEASVRKRAEELMVALSAVSAHVFDDREHREVYRVARKTPPGTSSASDRKNAAAG